MFTKEDICRMLDESGIHYDRLDHRAVFNMAESRTLERPHPEAEAKNLLVCDDRKQAYFLLTLRGEKQADLKAFRKAYGTRRLTFASPDDLMRLLGLIPGAVTPFGLLNDTAHAVEFHLDRSFLEGEGLIALHPCDNTATLFLTARDLMRFLEDHGTAVHLTEFA